MNTEALKLLARSAVLTRNDMPPGIARDGGKILRRMPRPMIEAWCALDLPTSLLLEPEAAIFNAARRAALGMTKEAV
jgi:hypothetical protein